MRRLLIALLLSLSTAAAVEAKPITTLYLFVHCTGSWDKDEVRREYGAKWKALLAEAGPREENAVCFLSSGPDSLALAEFAKQYFGERCIVDPYDDGLAVKALIADDVSAACSQRGNTCEWTPYEMWTSTNARKWTAGLQAEFAQRGLTYDPQQLRLVSCGQQWGGCLTKYSAFMGKYLGLTKPAEILPELSPYAGYPLQAKYRETIVLDRHVQLFLFETADGRPMAQFMDGLRGVFEPPHLALVEIDPATVDVVAIPPTENMQAQPVENPAATGSLLVDVGDGCRPVIASIVVRKQAGATPNFAEFRAAMAGAKILPFAKKHASRTRYVPVGCSELLCPIVPQSEAAALRRQ